MNNSTIPMPRSNFINYFVIAKDFRHDAPWKLRCWQIAGINHPVERIALLFEIVCAMQRYGIDFVYAGVNR